MKRLLIFLALFVITIFGVLFWWYWAAQPVSEDKSLKDFLIVRGTTALQTASNLQRAGFIRSGLAFKIYVQLTGKQSRIQAGEYIFSPSYSLFKLVEELMKGPVEVWVTIPEGLRREEVAQKFASTFGKGEDFVNEFITASSGQEGFLFPDTYLFPKTATASAVVKKMRATFDKKLDSQMRQDIESGAYDISQIVTLASIIERETKTPEERPIVAGILYKRLKIGMPLQVDATVQYVVATTKCQQTTSKCEWWPQTTIEDRGIKSPHNTYRYPGLPPAPIANPGLTSIKAAIYPTDSPYLYYLHDKDGHIHYARILEEHNENIRTYLGK